MSFAPDFVFYRDGRAPGADLPAAFWDGIKPEVNAELAYRRGTYPKLAAKGRLKQADADREVRVWQAIANDLAPARAHLGLSGATWAEKLHALRREIAIRRNLYPKWVEADRISPADADRRLLLVEQLHDLWWHSAVPDCRAIRAETLARVEQRQAA